MFSFPALLLGSRKRPPPPKVPTISDEIFSQAKHIKKTIQLMNDAAKKKGAKPFPRLLWRDGEIPFENDLQAVPEYGLLILKREDAGSTVLIHEVGLYLTNQLITEAEIAMFDGIKPQLERLFTNISVSTCERICAAVTKKSKSTKHGSLLVMDTVNAMEQELDNWDFILEGACVTDKELSLNITSKDLTPAPKCAKRNSITSRKMMISRTNGVMVVGHHATSIYPNPAPPSSPSTSTDAAEVVPKTSKAAKVKNLERATAGRARPARRRSGAVNDYLRQLDLEEAEKARILAQKATRVDHLYDDENMPPQGYEKAVYGCFSTTPASRLLPPLDVEVPADIKMMLETADSKVQQRANNSSCTRESKAVVMPSRTASGQLRQNVHLSSASSTRLDNTTHSSKAALKPSSDTDASSADSQSAASSDGSSSRIVSRFKCLSAIRSLSSFDDAISEDFRESIQSPRPLNPSLIRIPTRRSSRAYYQSLSDLSRAHYAPSDSGGHGATQIVVDSEAAAGAKSRLHDPSQVIESVRDAPKTREGLLASKGSDAEATSTAERLSTQLRGEVNHDSFHSGGVKSSVTLPIPQVKVKTAVARLEMVEKKTSSPPSTVLASDTVATIAAEKANALSCTEEYVPSTPRCLHILQIREHKRIEAACKTSSFTTVHSSILYSSQSGSNDEVTPPPSTNAEDIKQPQESRDLLLSTPVQAVINDLSQVTDKRSGSDGGYKSGCLRLTNLDGLDDGTPEAWDAVPADRNEIGRRTTNGFNDRRHSRPPDDFVPSVYAVPQRLQERIQLSCTGSQQKSTIFPKKMLEEATVTEYMKSDRTVTPECERTVKSDGNKTEHFSSNSSINSGHSRRAAVAGVLPHASHDEIEDCVTSTNHTPHTPLLHLMVALQEILQLEADSSLIDTQHTVTSEADTSEEAGPFSLNGSNRRADEISISNGLGDATAESGTAGFLNVVLREGEGEPTVNHDNDDSFPSSAVRASMVALQQILQSTSNPDDIGTGGRFTSGSHTLGPAMPAEAASSDDSPIVPRSQNRYARSEQLFGPLLQVDLLAAQQHEGDKADAAQTFEVDDTGPDGNGLPIAGDVLLFTPARTSTVFPDVLARQLFVTQNVPLMYDRGSEASSSASSPDHGASTTGEYNSGDSATSGPEKRHNNKHGHDMGDDRSPAKSYKRLSKPIRIAPRHRRCVVSATGSPMVGHRRFSKTSHITSRYQAYKSYKMKQPFALNASTSFVRPVTTEDLEDPFMIAGGVQLNKHRRSFFFTMINEDEYDSDTMEMAERFPEEYKEFSNIYESSVGGSPYSGTSVEAVSSETSDSDPQRRDGVSLNPVLEYEEEVRTFDGVPGAPKKRKLAKLKFERK